MQKLYIGLMSGTSMDAVDAVLVDFSSTPLRICAHRSEPIPRHIREKLLALCKPGENEINRMGELDVQMGRLFAMATNNLLHQASIPKELVAAIGSHGQTIRHQPKVEFPFTLQIGDPNVITELTGITTVADFRRRDIAKGGQGAPLVPAFHDHVFRSEHFDRVILNLGGIANITVLQKNKLIPIYGFDTGPANMLLDAWAQKHLDTPIDRYGAWAAEGKINNELLQLLLADKYFSLKPPKSTGREYFNLEWLDHYLSQLDQNISPQDVQTTLTELTAQTVVNAVERYGCSNGEVLICGGGIHNDYLISRFMALGKNYRWQSTEPFGVEPDLVEAIAFAWLARQTINGKPGNLPSVTGASSLAILGGVYPANYSKL